MDINELQYNSMNKYLAGSLLDGVIFTDTNGELVFLNPSAKEMLGLDDERVDINNILDHFFDSRSKPMPERAKIWLKKVLSGKWRFLSKELFLKKPVDLVVKADIQPVMDDEGNILGAATILRDISNEKEIDKMKSEFVSVVSHELKTPLTIIKAAVKTILDGSYGPLNEISEKILKTCSNNINRMERLIDDLLDISKIEAGKIELRCEPVNIKNIADEVVNQLVAKSLEKGIDIDVNVNSSEPISVYADTDKLFQIFNNLIFNGIKFTERGGRVAVNIYDKGDNVEVSVADTGRGIGKEDIPKLFSKFEQFGKKVSGAPKGTGLGLAITKNLVKMHGGDIRVDSSIGRGSTFTFNLPKSKADS